MQGVLRKLGALARDVAYGINTGNAIRHGLPVPEQSRRRARRPLVETMRGHHGE
jgi:hypothetical protein